MAHILPPFRADHVGSFLRSTKIANARRFFAEGSISHEQLQQIEDEEIAKLVQDQINNGIKAVTDGEFRRAYWHLDFLQGLNGLETIATKEWSVKFKDANPKATTVRIVDKISFDENHPFVDAFVRLKKIAKDHMVKYTIPSPSMLHLICAVREQNYTPIAMYQDENALYNDIAQAWIDAMMCLYNKGLRYLQLDDTSWGEFCSKEKVEAYTKRGLDIEHIKHKYVEVINKIMDAKPADMVVAMHICRGNFRSTWFSSGGYEAVAPELFANCKIDAFFLEYDSDRSGDFKPLRYIKDQTVVLGLITSKFANLEDEEQVKARIKEASEYVPLNQLCLSTQCGFSSTEEGNILTIDDQWAKIRLVCKIAKEIWPADA